MQLNTLSPARGSNKDKKRVGRGIGSGWGKTCGTGHKGQKSRSGGKVKPGFEGGQMPLQMRLPKYGFSSRIGRVTAEVRTSELNKVEGDIVTVDSLCKAGIIASKVKRVKIMLSGEVRKKLTIEGILVSKGAKEAVENVGGKVIELDANEPQRLVKKTKTDKTETKQVKENDAEQSVEEDTDKID